MNTNEIARPAPLRPMPKRYAKAGPAVLVPLFEQRSGWRLSVVRGRPDEFGLYSECGRRAARLVDTLWLHEWIADNHGEVFDYISEHRGRMVVDEKAREWITIDEHRSPVDCDVEHAIAGLQLVRQGQKVRKSEPAYVVVSWRLLVILQECLISASPDDWRFNRIRRQSRQLAEVIAARPKAWRPQQVGIQSMEPFFEAAAIHAAHRAIVRASEAPASRADTDPTSANAQMSQAA